MFEAMGIALGTIAEQSFPDTVTFRRPLNAKDSAGGNVVDATGNPTSPQSVPCLIRPTTGRERIQAGKPISGNFYLITIPNNFDDQLVDVDSSCLAQVAARAGGEEGRAYNIHAIERFEGLTVRLFCSLEE